MSQILLAQADSGSFCSLRVITPVRVDDHWDLTYSEQVEIKVVNLQGNPIAPYNNTPTVQLNNSILYSVCSDSGSVYFVQVDSSLSPTSVQTVSASSYQGADSSENSYPSGASMIIRENEPSVVYASGQNKLEVLQISIPGTKETLSADLPTTTTAVVEDSAPVQLGENCMTYPSVFINADTDPVFIIRSAVDYDQTHIAPDGEARGGRSGNTGTLTIDSLTAAQFKTLSTNSSLEWSTRKVTGLPSDTHPASPATAAFITDASGNTSLHVFYHPFFPYQGVASMLDKRAFCHFTLPLKPEDDTDGGTLDVAGADSGTVEAKNFSTVDWTYAAGGKGPLDLLIATNRRFSPAVAVVNGVVYIFFLGTIYYGLVGGEQDSGIAWFSQAFDSKGSLSPTGWYQSPYMIPSLRNRFSVSIIDNGFLAGLGLKNDTTKTTYPADTP